LAFWRARNVLAIVGERGGAITELFLQARDIVEKLGARRESMGLAHAGEGRREVACFVEAERLLIGLGRGRVVSGASRRARQD
jgi:hypothetical protein